MIRDPRVGVRSAVRRRRDAGRARASAAPRTAASSTGSATSVGRLKQRARRRPIARGSTTTSTTCARSSAASRRSRRTTRSGEPRELPGAPVGVPDSFDEHVKLMFDLQALAFASDITRVFAFKLGRDASNRVYPGERRQRRRSTPRRTTARSEDRILDFAKINKYHVSLMPYFLEKLKNTPDGDGNLLDNTLVALRLADGRLERAQPQARAAVPRRPRRRRAEGQPARQGAPTARRWPTRC